MAARRRRKAELIVQQSPSQAPPARYPSPDLELFPPPGPSRRPDMAPRKRRMEWNPGDRDDDGEGQDPERVRQSLDRPHYQRQAPRPPPSGADYGPPPRARHSRYRNDLIDLDNNSRRHPSPPLPVPPDAALQWGEALPRRHYSAVKFARTALSSTTSRPTRLHLASAPAVHSHAPISGHNNNVASLPFTETDVSAVSPDDSEDSDVDGPRKADVLVVGEQKGNQEEDVVSGRGDRAEDHREPDIAVVDDEEPDDQVAAVDSTNEALTQVLPLVPDVLPSHVENLLAIHSDDLGGNYAAAIETVVALLVDDPAYPRVGEDEADANKRDKEEEMDWLDVPARLRAREKPDPKYKSHVLDLLMDSFRDLPIKLIKTELAQRSHFFAPTLYALTTSERKGELATKKMKRPRAPAKKRVTFVAITEIDEETGEEVTRHEAREDVVPDLLAREKRWVEDKIAREDNERLRQQRADEKAERERERTENLDKQARRHGIAVECQCCFDDVAVENTTTCADGHLFCKTCAAANANTRLGQLQAALPCMAADCTAVFLPITYSNFLPAITIDALADLAQQKDLETAFDGVEGFEKCPFCPFACFIESKMEKLFRCLRAECRKVSCRQCKLENHIPKTCEEVAKERSLASVHGVEEAMTAALIKNCPKCKVPTCKQDGCNKMTCSNCGIYWCHSCGEQITGYEHFADENYGGKNPDGCPTFHDTTAREREAIEAARLRAQVDLDEDAREAAEKLAEPPLDRARRDHGNGAVQEQHEQEQRRAQVEAEAEAEAARHAQAQRQAHRQAQQQAQRQAQRQQQRQAHRRRQRQARQQAQAQAAYVAYAQAQARAAHQAYAAQQQAEAYQAYVAQQQRQQAEEWAYAAHRRAQAQAAHRAYVAQQQAEAWEAWETQQRLYLAQQQRHAQHRAQAEADYRAYVARQQAQAPPTQEEIHAAEMREQQQVRRRVQERAQAQAQEAATWHAAMANAQNAINNVWANFAGVWRGW